MFSSANALTRFRRYVDATEQLAQGRKALGPVEWRQIMTMSLDGEPGRVLRRDVAYPQLRQQGAYFTGTKMATRLANAVSVDLHSRKVYFDPTCGAGDLLLAVAKKLPIAGTLRENTRRLGAMSGRLRNFSRFRALGKGQTRAVSCKALSRPSNR